MAKRKSNQPNLFDQVQDAGRKTRNGDGAVHGGGIVEDVSLAQATRDRYLNYALSVITSRALPDVRDGLKPVQRRILYAMYHNLHLTPDHRYSKSAAVVGETMKSFHPHGDQSIYDAMVRMAQSFSMRYPLIDGQGNFGSLDGDPPAAMRYTEARLRHLAVEMLSELKQETVDYRASYDGSGAEPEVLPAQVPNLLINGATGIAVGMATNIPPHNLGEVVTALVALIDNRKLTVDELCGLITGPDFPTGGVILNTPEELRAIYRTGQGAIKVRGTYSVEKDGRNRQIVITSIPYTVQKSELVARIGELIGKNEVPQLADVRDESTEDVRVVCELKFGGDPDAAMAYLFKHTPLQTNFNVNLTCLLPAESAAIAVPKRLDLKELLHQFLQFRLQVVTRRLEHELRVVRERIHVLEGFAIIFNALDEAIRIIRASDGKPDAARRLIDRFKLTAVQTEAILETKLYRLSKLEIQSIRAELTEQRKRAAAIEKLLESEKKRWRIVRAELLELADAYGDQRQTTIEGPPREIAFRQEDYIIDEDSWVVVTRDGWIKRQKGFTEVSGIRVRDGDRVEWLYRGRARQTVTFYTSKGVAYTLRINDVPMTSGYGEPVQRHFSMDDGERVVGVSCSDPRCVPTPVPPPAEAMASQPDGSGAAGDAAADGAAGMPPPPYGIALTRGGKVLRFALAAFAAPSLRNGRLFARLDKAVPGDEVVGVEPTAGDETVCLATHQARVMLFPVWEANVVSGPAKGVTAIKLQDADRVIGFALATKKRDGLTVETNRGATVVVRATKYRVASRGGKGYPVLQRGNFERIVSDEPRPVPDVSEVAAEPDAGSNGQAP